MPTYHYLVPENLSKQRIDKALVELCQDFSRSQIQKAIKSQKVTVNEKIIENLAAKVQIDDAIVIEIEEEVCEHIEPKEMDFEIIYEDEDLLVINKPVGLTVHPGAGNYSDTLVNGLLHHAKYLSDIGGEGRPGIVHRLDKDTSGLMVVAKNNHAHQILADQIKERELTRKYKALIWGTMKPFEGVVDLPIGRDSQNRLKMTVVKSGGKEAITHYNTLEILCSGLFSLLECQLETGRTHQIRVHLSHMRHSIVGDQTYGNNTRKIQAVPDILKPHLNAFTQQALHSYYISFFHPRTNERLEFTTELNDKFLKLVELLRSNWYTNKKDY